LRDGIYFHENSFLYSINGVYCFKQGIFYFYLIPKSLFLLRLNGNYKFNNSLAHNAYEIGIKNKINKYIGLIKKIKKNKIKKLKKIKKK
jgi:hypothetical protein